ncbi:MAG: SixA phosphatase family protein [Pirellula sp.]|jgi:phosphohistidine phosphatase
MIDLMLMRHAKSDWADESLSDFERPLNARGKKAAPLMGEWMREHHLVPNRILCSTATRAKETLFGLERAWATHQTEKVIVEFVDDLYLASPTTILEIIQHHHREAQRLLVIGHNPGMELLATQLAREQIEMTTANVVVLKANLGWDDALRQMNAWKLTHHEKPKKE